MGCDPSGLPDTALTVDLQLRSPYPFVEGEPITDHPVIPELLFDFYMVIQYGDGTHSYHASLNQMTDAQGRWSYQPNDDEGWTFMATDESAVCLLEVCLTEQHLENLDQYNGTILGHMSASYVDPFGPAGFPEPAFADQKLFGCQAWFDRGCREAKTDIAQDAASIVSIRSYVGTRMHLTNGTVVYHVARPEESSFEIDEEDNRLAVKGTYFPYLDCAYSGSSNCSLTGTEH
jgi:hypothetical protein